MQTGIAAPLSAIVTAARAHGTRILIVTDTVSATSADLAAALEPFTQPFKAKERFTAEGQHVSDNAPTTDDGCTRRSWNVQSRRNAQDIANLLNELHSLTKGGRV